MLFFPQNIILLVGTTRHARTGAGQNGSASLLGPTGGDPWTGRGLGTGGSDGAREVGWEQAFFSG